MKWLETPFQIQKVKTINILLLHALAKYVSNFNFFKNLFIIRISLNLIIEC